MNLNRPPQTQVWRLNQSRPRIGVLVLSPDFVKSFRLCHFRRKKWKVKISSMWESIVVRKV
ncbi:hypothetical protein BWD13_04605 [Leptospira santarosai serovar Grippotyphosa]|nr:hypothetical protein BWD13_04605 [Leptospira santarosai serovar Grippotyphosa]